MISGLAIFYFVVESSLQNGHHNRLIGLVSFRSKERKVPLKLNVTYTLLFHYKTCLGSFFFFFFIPTPGAPLHPAEALREVIVQGNVTGGDHWSLRPALHRQGGVPRVVSFQITRYILGFAVDLCLFRPLLFFFELLIQPLHNEAIQEVKDNLGEVFSNRLG